MYRHIRTRLRSTDDDAGIALVIAVGLTLAMLLLAAVMAGLAVHNISLSALDRSRVQSTSGAEGVIDETDLTLQGSPPSLLPCTLTQTMPNGEKVNESVAYYSAYPPTAASALTCTPGAGTTVPPAGAILLATGTTPPATGGLRAVETIEQQVQLSTVSQPFTNALFSRLTLSNQRTLTVYGQKGNNGDVYTGGNWVCQQGDTIYGSVDAQGYADLGGNCHVAGDVWANGPILATNADSIGGNATSSTSCIGLNGASACTVSGGGTPPAPGGGRGGGGNQGAIIAGNATSGTTCTYSSQACAAPDVTGTVTQNHTSPSPPTQAFPIVAFNPSDWTSQGYTVDTFSGSSACSQAEMAIDSGFGTTPTVVNVTEDCPLIWSRSGPGLSSGGGPKTASGSCPGGSGFGISLSANLAIVTNGPIFLDHDVTFCSTSSPTPSLFLLVPDTAANQQACVYAGTPGAPPPSAWDKLSNANNTDANNPNNNPAGQTTWTTQLQVTSPDLDSEDSTTFQNVNAVYYTPCTVDMEDPTLSGQIYAGSVVLENKLSLHYQPLLIPGNGVPSGNKVNIAYLRQVPPGTSAP